MTKVLAIAWFVFVAAVYCPDVGRGFIKDDFTWIRTARTVVADPAMVVKAPEGGFYRPMVTLAFALDYEIHGWQPRGYGWTNLALYAACALALAGLTLALGLSPQVAALAAFLWAVNPHGVNMAVTWLSGRTALLLTLFSLGAAIAFTRRWYAAAAALVACALLSKEEAVALPFILLAWSWLDRGERPPWAAVVAVCVPLAGYAWLRGLSAAMTPATAPWFYRFTVDPLTILRNAAEYLDRSATLAAAAVLLAILVHRRRPALGDRRGVFAMMAVWFVGMFAITLWLPVRSSLCAVCPSIAAALAGALLIDSTRQPSTRRRIAFEPVLVLLLMATIPLFQRRDDLRVEAARVSDRTLKVIARDLDTLPPTGVVVLHDDPEASVFGEAFGDLPTEALQTRFQRQWNVRIDRGPASPAAADSGVIAQYWIRHGTVSRAPLPKP